MTEEHRQHQLAIAADHLASAKARYEAATTFVARCQNDEDIEFWGSKVAFLTVIASETVR